MQAFLEERRDKVIRLNTIANFISGGVTGIVGGALKIGSVNEQSANGIDTGEGITQTALALLALKQQAGEKKIVDGTPNMLTKLFDINAIHTQRDYPPSVWNYLTSVPESSSTGLTEGTLTLLTPVALADALVNAQVEAVVNAAQSISGRFPNLGPEVLVASGITLLDDVGIDVFNKVREGVKVRINDDKLYIGERRVALGVELVETDIADRMIEAKSGVETAVATCGSEVENEVVNAALSALMRWKALVRPEII